MKLFLSSISVQSQNKQKFLELFGPKEPKDIKVGVITNGGDTYAEDKRAWMERDHKLLKETGAQIVLLDLRKIKNIKDELSKYDCVWIGGGNVFYLRYILAKTGADEIIIELVKSGTVYGGDSAGAIIAGPTINYFQPADSPEKSPKIILDGLNLLDVVVVPHADHSKYAPIMKDIKINLTEAGYKTKSLNDSDSLVIIN